MKPTLDPLRSSLLALVASLAACGAGDHNPWYPNPGNDGPPSPACLHAREQRTRVPGLVAEGKLYRALRVMQFTEGACPTEAPVTWAAHVSALAAAGRLAEARSLAARIERSDRTTAEDRRAATRALAEAAARDLAAATSADVSPPSAPFRWTPDDDTRFEAAWTAKESAVALFLGGVEASAKRDYAAAKQRFLAAWAASRPNPRALLEAGLAAESLGDRVEAQRLWDRAAFDGTEASRPDLPNGAPVGAFDTRLAWSSAGHLLALASEGKIAVYDAASLRLRRRIEAREPVTSVAFSPDETELFAGLESGKIRRYHLVLDTVRRDLDGHSGPVVMMSVAPDGQRIATASTDGTLRIWGGAQSGPKVLPMPKVELMDLVWSGDGGLLAWAEEARVGVWDTRTFALVGVVEPRGGVIRAISFGPDGKTLSVVNATQKLRYDLARFKAAPRVVEKAAVELAAARAEVVAAATAAEVTIKDLTSSAALASFPITPPNTLLRMALSPDGKTLAAAFLGHTLRLYPVTMGAMPGKPVAAPLPPVTDELSRAAAVRAVAPTSPLEALAISPDGKVFTAGAEDGSVQLWRAAPPSLRLLERAADAGAHIRAVTFSPDGKLLAFGSDTGAVAVWDAAALRPLGSFRTEAAVFSLGFSPDSSRLAVGADAPLIHLLNPLTAAPTGELRLNAGAVRALGFSTDGKSLLTASQEGVTLWDPIARKGARYVVYGLSPHDLAWAVDGSSFAVAGSDASLAIGSTASASPSQVIPIPPHVVALAFSSAGNIATAEADRSLVYRTAKGKLIQRFHEPDAPVRKVAFTKDGAIVGAFADGSIRIFRPPVPRAVASLRAAPGSAPGAEAGVAMTPAGHVDFIGDSAAMRATATCRIGAMIYPFSVCAEQFLVPGLFSMALAGQDPAEAEP